MVWLRRKKNNQTPPPSKDVPAIPPPPFDPIVEKAKKRTDAATESLNKKAGRLNGIFVENGITFNILTIASGDNKHGH